MKKKETIKVPKTLFREATIATTGEGEARAFSMSISTEAAQVLRYDWMNDREYYEVLDHGPGGVNTDRLDAGMPILFNHDRDQHLARAKSYSMEGGKCTLGDFVWSGSDFAQSKKRDAENGSLPDTSVGYRVTGDGQKIGERDGIPVIKFQWQPFEGSLVTVPADIGTGVGRHQRDKEAAGSQLEEISVIDNSPESKRKLMSDQAETSPSPKPEPTATRIDVKEVESKAVATERKRVADIQELEKHFREKGLAGRKIDTAELASEHVREGKTSRDFQDAVVRGNFKEVAPVVTETPEIGMSQKEAKSFSFLRAIYNLGTGRGLQGLEKEASDAHGKQIKVECGPNSFYVPMDVQRGRAFPNGMSQDQVRALFSNVYSGAGAFVGTELLGASLIELLRNQMLVVQMGARSMSGLQGNVAIPRQTGGATASWLAEDSTITATQQTVGQLNLTPHKLAAATAFTEQFAMQTSVDAENFVRQDLMAVTAIARDLAAISGSGVSGQPVGILNLGSANLSTPVTLSAAQSMTYANAVKFELNVSTNNALSGKLGYMVSPTVRNNAKLIAEISSTNSNPVWKDNRVNGYPALATNQQPTGTSVIFGNWDDLILADWSQSNFFVDPYSLSLQGQIRVINRLYCDNGVRHGTSFSVAVG